MHQVNGTFKNTKVLFIGGVDSDQRGSFSILFDAYTEFNVEDFINFFVKGITEDVNVLLDFKFPNGRVLEDEELQQA